MTASLRDEITGALTYPANDNTGASGTYTLRISGRVHPAALRTGAEIQFMLWRYPRVLPQTVDHVEAQRPR